MSQYVEVTRQSFWQRGKNSVLGALFGIVLVAAGTIGLFWNEGRAVKRYKDLKEGAGVVVSVSSEHVDSENEGKLVHLTGESKTETPLKDDEFGVSLLAVKLIRKVEMYQWAEDVRTETKEKIGGGTEQTKTYSYKKQWSDRVIDSANFKVTAGHQNPSAMKYNSSTLVAEKVTLGAFNLPPFLINKINAAEPLALETLDAASEAVKEEAKLAGGYVYLGADPEAPRVGDLRVSFSSVATGPVSVVAQQQGSTFVTYRAKTGGSVDLLESGTMSASEMFQLAQDRNKMLTWAIRVGGFFLLAMAFSMILAPLATLASVFPFLGRLVGTGNAIVSFLFAGILWTITVAVAWIVYRPLLGITILLVTVALIVMVIKRLRRSSAARPASPPLASGPPPLA